MIILTTMIYQKERVNEVITCLKKNLQIDIVEKYVIFIERKDGDEKFFNLIKSFDSIDLIEIDFRPTIKYMIEYVNDNYKDQICDITNSDILYDDTLNKLSNIDFNICYLALTRYNILNHTDKENYKYKGSVIDYKLKNTETNIKLKTMHSLGQSADSWFFKAPLKIDNIDIDFPLGTFSGDGYLNDQLSLNKEVYNPVNDIISIHLHKNWNPNHYKQVNHSSRTFWKKKYRLNELMIPFCQLKDCPLKNCKNKDQVESREKHKKIIKLQKKMREEQNSGEISNLKFVKKKSKIGMNFTEKSN